MGGITSIYNINGDTNLVTGCLVKTSQSITTANNVVTVPNMSVGEVRACVYKPSIGYNMKIKYPSTGKYLAWDQSTFNSSGSSVTCNVAATTYFSVGWFGSSSNSLNGPFLRSGGYSTDEYGFTTLSFVLSRIA